QRRGPGDLLPQPRPDPALPCTGWPGRARGHPHLRGLPRAAELRLDDRQADRARPGPRDRDLPHARGAERDGGRRDQDQHPAAAPDHARQGLPGRRPEHPLPGKAPGRAQEPVDHAGLTAMPYLELSLRSTEAEQPRYERALEDVGALSVTLLDADADTPDERAILEPGVGETPVWKSLVLSALFDADADALALLAALESFDPSLDWAGASFRAVEDQDWERVWLD